MIRRISGQVDYRALAELHRPTDADGLRAADIQSTAMQLLATLQETDMCPGDRAEVVSAFGEAAAMSLPRQ